MRVAHFPEHERGSGVIQPRASAFTGTRHLYLFTIIVLCAGFGCSRHEAKPEIAVTTEFSPQPARIGRESVTVNLKDSASRPVSGAHVTVEGNMSHPGMAPVFGAGKEIEPGRYEASLALGMRGSWVISLHVRLAKGEKMERQIPIEVKAE